MIRINLLPNDRRGGGVAIDGIGTSAGIIGFFLLAASSFLVVYLVWSNYEDRLAYARGKIKEEDRAINGLKKAIKLIKIYKKRKKELERQLKVLQKLSTARRGPVRFLDELSIRIPEKIWLNSIQQRRGSTVKINGFAEDNNRVASFLKKLETSPFVSNVNLRSSQRRSIRQLGRKKSKSMMSFTLSCKIARAAN